jgi:hypothetical protein
MFQDRNQIREIFFSTWQKYKKQEVLSPLEQQLLAVIQQHPEYHTFLDDPKKFNDADFTTDNNPFLHMGLHLSLMEQLGTNRPAGIRTIYQTLAQKHNDKHQAEHIMMNALAETLWDAQQSGKMPDEQAYLNKLKNYFKFAN